MIEQLYNLCGFNKWKKEKEFRSNNLLMGSTGKVQIHGDFHGHFTILGEKNPGHNSIHTYQGAKPNNLQRL